MFLICFLSFPIFYFAYTVENSPIILPLVELSNGQKKVMFQGMQHIGSEDFYKSVVYDLEEAANEGYTLFFEGVQNDPMHPEDVAWFNKLVVGEDDLGSFYSLIAQSCGLVFQSNYFRTLESDKKIHPDKHITADVTYSQLKKEYERLLEEDSEFESNWKAENKNSKSETSLLELAQSYQQLSDRQQKLLGIACRGMINTLTQRAEPHKSVKDRIIIDFRNKNLAKMILNTTADKIYITYGARHFEGLLKELQNKDQNWKIKTISWKRVMSNPENLSGQL